MYWPVDNGEIQCNMFLSIVHLVHLQKLNCTLFIF